MKNTHANTFRLFLALWVVFIITACKSAETANPPSAPGIQLNITLDNCPSVIVKVGDQMTWINKDKVDLVVHAETADGTLVFDSGILKPGDSFSFTFPEKAVYNYRCTPDGSLTGTIAVEP